MRVLITGIGGAIGTIVCDDLSGDHEVSGIDIRPVERKGAHVADLTDFDAIRPLFDGVDTVVHLAAERRHGREIGWDLLMPRNVVATANVFDAAHAARVKRVVFASSMHVMGMYEEDEPYASIAAGRYEGIDADSASLISADMPTRPDGRYAATKVLGESLARYYAEAEGMSGVCVRLGTLSADNRPGREPRSFVSWLSHRDAAGLFRACVDAPSLNYEIVYGASANTWRIYDTPRSWRTLGFQPQDNAERFRNIAV